jgi:hypothetical protein
MSTERDATYDMLGRVNDIKDRGALTVLLVALQAQAKVLEDQEAKADAAEAETDAASVKADNAAKTAESTKVSEERAADDAKGIAADDALTTQFVLKDLEIECGEQALLYRMSTSHYRRLYLQYTVPCMVLTTSVALFLGGNLAGGPVAAASQDFDCFTECLGHTSYGFPVTFWVPRKNGLL